MNQLIANKKETFAQQLNDFEGQKVVSSLLIIEGRVVTVILVENIQTRVNLSPACPGYYGAPPTYSTVSLHTYRLVGAGPAKSAYNKQGLADYFLKEKKELQNKEGRVQLYAAVLHTIPFGTAADRCAAGSKASNVGALELTLVTVGDLALVGGWIVNVTSKGGKALYGGLTATRIARGIAIVDAGINMAQAGIAAKNAIDDPTAGSILVAAAISSAILVGVTYKYTKKKAPNQILSKGERLAEFNKRLTNAPGAKTADEALQSIGKTLDSVEDAFSGVPKSANPGLKYDCRMYPPQADNIQRLADGSIKIRTKGNRIDIGANGSITITDLNGNVILTKPGG